MTSQPRQPRQPRQPAGTRRSGASTGGQYASKTVPTINSDLGFHIENQPPVCTERKVKIWGLSTTFTRRVNPDGTVTVTTDCDPPDMMLLTRKGNADYWTGNTWVKHHRDRRLWTADITRRMLQEGHVADDTAAIHAAMSAASSPRNLPTRYGYRRVGPHALTTAVAQIRGLRLIESMAPSDGWETKLGGWYIPNNSDLLLSACFDIVFDVYGSLPRPPWDDTTPPRVPWGARHDGYATTSDGTNMFVGEQGDLLWRALTETDNNGRSPLKARLRRYGYRTLTGDAKDMVVAAVLYDDTAARQLTHGLFDGVPDPANRQRARQNMLYAFTEALNPPDGRGCRWTVEQQARIRGFIETVEALQPEPVEQVA